MDFYLKSPKKFSTQRSPSGLSFYTCYSFKLFPKATPR